MISSAEAAAPLALPELRPDSGREDRGEVRAAADGALELPELDASAVGRGLPPALPRAATDEAYERGFADGLAEGAARAQQRVRTALEALGRVGEYLHSTQSALLRDRARDVHALALAVARKLVQREVTADPELIHQLVAQAFELLPAESYLEVRLHPDDLATFARELPDPGSGRTAAAIQWVGDPTMERGEFVVESPQRIVDGRADFALRALYERLDHD